MAYLLLIISLILIFLILYYKPFLDYDQDHVYIWYDKHTKNGIERAYKVI